MRSILLFFSFLFLPVNLFAFKMSPMTQELEISKNRRKAVFTLFNESKKPIAVISEMTKRLIDESGKEKNPDASDEFMIFPDQLIIKPGEKRAVQVTWLGDRELKVEEAYRFIAEQLPVDVDLKNAKNKKSNIKILLKYRAAFYLTPKGAKARLSLEKNNVLVNENKVEISILNSGNKHELLRKYNLVFSSGKKQKETVSFKDYSEIYGENLLAKSKRKFLINIPKSFIGKKEIRISIEAI